MNERRAGVACIVSKRRAHGQLIFCQGCCCGRTERGFAEVPVERLKAVWKAKGLNRTIQMTVSGCVGPCDVANVAVVVTPSRTTWLGGLDCAADYDALLRWAESCHDAGTLLPLPEVLVNHRFEWFLAEPREPIVPACTQGAGPVPDSQGAPRSPDT